MAERDPIRERFGADVAPSFESGSDPDQLEKEQIRNREKDRDTWRAIDGFEDPDLDNPYIQHGG